MRRQRHALSMLRNQRVSHYGMREYAEMPKQALTANDRLLIFGDYGLC